MKKEITYENALHKAAAYCSASEKCEYDVREKLELWGLSADESEKIIARLISENFLDEKRFTSFFVRDKFRFNKWGKIKIAYVLKQKKISTQLIQESLDTIDEEEYKNLLKDLFQTKQRGLKFKDQYDKQAKLYRFAQSRGFEAGIISQVIAQFLDK